MPENTRRVKVFDKAELDRRRSTILASVRTTEADLRDRGGRYALDADELAVYEELKSLNYLRNGVHRPA